MVVIVHDLQRGNGRPLQPDGIACGVGERRSHAHTHAHTHARTHAHTHTRTHATFASPASTHLWVFRNVYDVVVPGIMYKIKARTCTPARAVADDKVGVDQLDLEVS